MMRQRLSTKTLLAFLTITIASSAIPVLAQLIPANPPTEWGINIRFYGTTALPPGRDDLQISIRTNGQFPARISARHPIYDERGIASLKSPEHEEKLSDQARAAIYDAARSVILNHRIGEKPNVAIRDGGSVEVTVSSFDRKLSAGFDHSSAENSKEFQALIKVLSSALPKEFQPGAVTVTDDSSAVDSKDDLVRKLGRLHGRAETDQAVAELAQRGDATADDIERLSPEFSSDFGWLHTSVRILEKINTEKSRALLKKIAVGEIERANPGVQGWAAQALIKCDSSQARELLSSSNPEVLERAVLSLRGHGLNQELLDSLKPLIDSEHPLTRWRAASIMSSEAPRGELADEALTYIVKALVAVEENPALDQIDPSTGLVNYQMTTGEWHYQAYSSILHQVNVENSILHEVAKPLQGRARDTVMLSLAFRGDQSVHDDIVKLAQDKDASMFRAWAVAALGEIGTVDDLPLLQRLSKTDPLKRSGGGHAPHSNFPVRQRAEQSIKMIERKAKQK